MTGLETLVDGRFYTPLEVAKAIGLAHNTVRHLCRTHPEFCTRIGSSRTSKIMLTKAHATALFDFVANPPKPDPRDPDYDAFA